MDVPRRRFLTYANIMATLALFVALGGGAYAATLITGKQIKDGSITSADIKNGTLLAADFKAGQLKQGPAGAAGPAGPQGVQGVAGAPGVAGSALAFVHINADGTIDANAKGVTAGNVSHPAPGTFCISGLATAPKNAVVSLGPTGAAAFVFTTIGPSPILGCTASTTQVSIGMDDGVAAADTDVWVTLN